MDNRMENLKVAVFYETNIYQQIICQYLEKEIKNAPLSLDVISSVDDLLEKIADNQVDVLITEFSYLYSHKDWSRNISSRFCKLCTDNHVRRIMFISGANVWMLRKIIDMHFEVIVSANDNITELQRAMASVISNENHVPYISESIKSTLRMAHKGAPGLSSKEWGVLYLLAEGFSVSEIAARKNRAVSTVATQKHNAMKKLNITTNSELIKFIQLAGIME